MPSAIRYLGDMAGLGATQPGSALLSGIIYQPYYALTFAAAAVATWLLPQAWDWTRQVSAVKATVVIAVLILAIVALTTQAYNPFIYFIF